MSASQQIGTAVGVVATYYWPLAAVSAEEAQAEELAQAAGSEVGGAVGLDKKVVAVARV